jgi:hypothetical protein
MRGHSLVVLCSSGYCGRTDDKTGPNTQPPNSSRSQLMDAKRVSCRSQHKQAGGSSLALLVPAVRLTAAAPSSPRII